MKFFGIFVVIAATAFLSTDGIFQGSNWASKPWVARIQYLQIDQSGAQGGGAIISQRHILCSGFMTTINFVNYNIFVGSNTRAGQRAVPFQSVIRHPAYQGNPRLNDIGIIMVAQDIQFDRTVSPIALPSLQFVGQLPLLNEQGLVLGFGGVPGAISQTLQAAFMRVVSVERCAQRWPASQAVQQFCAEDVRSRTDFCGEDVGNSFTTLERDTEVLVGIASVANCVVNVQLPSQPSLVTRITFFRLWINQNTQV